MTNHKMEMEVIKSTQQKMKGTPLDLNLENNCHGTGKNYTENSSNRNKNTETKF